MTPCSCGSCCDKPHVKLSTWALFALSVIVIVALDRMAKLWALQELVRGQSIAVIPNIFHITLVLNSGAAFGLFKGRADLFIALSCVFMSIIILYVWRSGRVKPLGAMVLGLIFGGAAGNLVDRISSGHVVDFIDLRIWPVFNIADSAITIGACLLIAGLFLRKAR